MSDYVEIRKLVYHLEENGMLKVGSVNLERLLYELNADETATLYEYLTEHKSKFLPAKKSRKPTD